MLQCIATENLSYSELGAGCIILLHTNMGYLIIDSNFKYHIQIFDYIVFDMDWSSSIFPKFKPCLLVLENIEVNTGTI